MNRIIKKSQWWETMAKHVSKGTCTCVTVVDVEFDPMIIDLLKAAK